MRVRAKKKYGQHFLQPAWADKLVDTIAPRPEQRFVEIGPGLGILTLRLAPRVSHLTAVEIDDEMVAALELRLPSNVTLIHADILELDLESIAGAEAARVVGNLPYNVASPILFRLLETYRRCRCLVDATLMVQREVADRITAAPGGREYGVLSIFVQRRCDVQRVLTLPPGAFRPAPRVQSAVVHFRFHDPSVTVVDERTFEDMVRSMFTQRRKTLSNALKPFASARGADPAVALAATAIDPRRRPETLQLTELAQLADYFASA